MTSCQRAILGVAAIASLCLLPGITSAQTRGSAGTGGTPSRTSWGDPDLQGRWTNTTTTPLQRPTDLADRKDLSDEELAQRREAARANVDRPPRAGDPGSYNDFWFEKGALNRRTSLVIDPPDGRLPAITPEAQQQAADARRGRGPSDSWLDRSVYERCITRGLPGAMMPGFYNHNYQIFQTPGYVVILVEMIHDARIIPIDGRPHLGTGLRQWLGDSRGRWEGDTLVVETTNFNDKVKERSLIAFSTGQHLRLVERFRRVDRNSLDYQLTVEDPTTFVRPWTASIPMVTLDGPIYEYACHEGNYGLVGILSGARNEEEKKASDTTGGKK
jgi:hypothetical protein